MFHSLFWDGSRDKCFTLFSSNRFAACCCVFISSNSFLIHNLRLKIPLNLWGNDLVCVFKWIKMKISHFGRLFASSCWLLPLAFNQVPLLPLPHTSQLATNWPKMNTTRIPNTASHTPSKTSQLETTNISMNHAMETRSSVKWVQKTWWHFKQEKFWMKK